MDKYSGHAKGVSDESFDHDFGSDDAVVIEAGPPLTPELLQAAIDKMFKDYGKPPAPQTEFHHPKCVAFHCDNYYCDCGSGSSYLAHVAFRPGFEERAPSLIPVTDPYLDAPDGAVVFFDEHLAFYERVDAQWSLRPGWHPER